MQCFFATTGGLRRRTTFGVVARALVLTDHAEIVGRACPACAPQAQKCCGIWEYFRDLNLQLNNAAPRGDRDGLRANEVHLPAEFQAALYKNLIKQLDKKGGFGHVYRDGDRNAANISDLVVLSSTVRGFKQGSEKKHQVTTVAGATSITIHCQFTDSRGKVSLERDIKGKVRFFGENVKATNDFAKKASTVAQENFSTT